MAKGAHPEADFIPIVAWGQLAEICGDHLAKGQRILISGRLQIRPYETKDGQKRRVAEVIAQSIEFLDKKAAGEQKASAVEEFNGEEIPF